jgi:hypothetical protein
MVALVGMALQGPLDSWAQQEILVEQAVAVEGAVALAVVAQALMVAVELFI